MSIIIGIKLEERLENSLKFQEILSKYGCYIRTRLGLHDNDNNSCTNWGIIILEFSENKEILSSFEKEINLIKNVILKKIIF